MNNIITEKEYQVELLNTLRDQNGYTIRKATDFDRRFAIDREMLFGFLNDTQPETLEKLRKIHKDRLEDTIVSFINAECTKKRGSLLEVLRHGVELSGHKLELMFTKPATTFNKDLMRKYEMNRFTVMEEVWANDKERIDVVIFLNGFAIISMELKCNYAGQSTDDAIYQYRMERDPKSRLFLFKAGTLVNFAMDMHEVYMTTKLDGKKTFFLPFNQGNGEGVNAGAGNAPREDDYPVHYMWDDILTKDTILDLISKFIFIQTSEKENEKTGKVEVKESIIFPRYHQLDAVRKLLADVEENRTSLNYLIQHSAGSGKTNTIAWLAYRLATLHDADNKIIFDITTTEKPEIPTVPPADDPESLAKRFISEVLVLNYGVSESVTFEQVDLDGSGNALPPPKVSEGLISAVIRDFTGDGTPELVTVREQDWSYIIDTYTLLDDGYALGGTHTREPLKTMFLEVGVGGEAPHIALLLFV